MAEEKVIKNPVENKRGQSEEWQPFTYIDEENIQFLYDKLGEKGMNKILDEYFELIEFDIDDCFEQKGCNFDDWIKEIGERMEEGEFIGDTKEEICQKLLDEIYEFI